jgi:inorganic pyrophosphatase
VTIEALTSLMSLRAPARAAQKPQARTIPPRPRDPPKCVDVVVESPQGARSKHEIGHSSGRTRLDRKPFTSTIHPGDYGYLPDTLPEDGDPIDGMLLVSEPTFPGCLLTVRPIGLYSMSDEHGSRRQLLDVHDRDPGSPTTPTSMTCPTTSSRRSGTSSTSTRHTRTAQVTKRCRSEAVIGQPQPALLCVVTEVLHRRHHL